MCKIFLHTTSNTKQKHSICTQNSALSLLVTVQRPNKWTTNSLAQFYSVVKMI